MPCLAEVVHLLHPEVHIFSGGELEGLNDMLDFEEGYAGTWSERSAEWYQG